VSGQYVQPLGTGVLTSKVTSYNLTGLQGKTTYYFALTAIDGAGNESSYSNEAIKAMQ
jgi:hypothetical protein